MLVRFASPLSVWVPTGIEFVRNRSSVPMGLRVNTAAVRIRPPNFTAAFAPGMRIEPGKSPADTMSGGSSGDFSAFASIALSLASSSDSQGGMSASASNVSSL
jgi:hypothetical protein